MTEIAPMSDASRVYDPNRLKKTAIGMGWLASAAVFAWLGWAGGYLPWQPNWWPMRDPHALAVWIMGPLLLGYAVLRLLEALCGRPRLTVTGDGIELETFFGTKWAKWSSLAKFELKQQHAARGNATISFASSLIVGEEASKNLFGRRTFKIPDAFFVSIPELITTLNARRTQALGLSIAPEAKDKAEQTSATRTALGVAAGVAVAVVVLTVAAHH